MPVNFENYKGTYIQVCILVAQIVKIIYSGELLLI